MGTEEILKTMFPKSNSVEIAENKDVGYITFKSIHDAFEGDVTDIFIFSYFNTVTLRKHRLQYFLGNFFQRSSNTKLPFIQIGEWCIFVEFDSEDICEKAKSKLAATRFGDREIYVDYMGKKSKSWKPE